MSLAISLVSSSSVPSSAQFIALLEQLYQERALVHCPAGSNIAMQAQALYVPCRGVAQLHTIHADGSETIVGLCGPSMAFGRSFSQVAPYWATALTDVDVLPLSLAEVEASQPLSAALFAQIIRRLQQAEAWLAISGKRLVGDRLQSLLVQLAQDFGQVETGGVRIKLRLTHHQLATIVGTTRVTVTRLLGEFKAAGWLSTQQRYLVLSPQAAGLYPGA